MAEANGSTTTKRSRTIKALETPTVTTGPLAGSEKVYIKGKMHDIEVPMRKISLTDSPAAFAANGQGETNAPVFVYDTSGPYTDPNAEIDIYKGLAKIRRQWILDREDVEELPGQSSTYANERLNDPKLGPIRYPEVPRPLKAKAAQTVSQMHYAKKGMITEEMP